MIIGIIAVFMSEFSNANARNAEKYAKRNIIKGVSSQKIRFYEQVITQKTHDKRTRVF